MRFYLPTKKTTMGAHYFTDDFYNLFIAFFIIYQFEQGEKVSSLKQVALASKKHGISQRSTDAILKQLHLQVRKSAFFLLKKKKKKKKNISLLAPHF